MVELFNNYQFMKNPLIQKIGHDSNWTISDNDKRPLDVNYYLKTGSLNQLAKLNNEDGYSPLTDLYTLNQDPKLEMTNRAYRLDGRHNHILCVDIEPIAKDTLNNTLGKLPFDYLEYSKHYGFHGLIEVPDELINDENKYLFALSGIKIPDKTFEIIINKHYVTFTKNVIKLIDYSDEYRLKSIAEFIEKLIDYDEQNQKQRTETNVANISVDIPDYINNLKSIIPDSDFEYIKKMNPEMYDGDESRYEFNMCLNIKKQLMQRMAYGFDDPFIILNLPESFNRQLNHIDALTEEEYTYLTYLFAKEFIPFREKHSSYRNGLPWLLYQAQVATVNDKLKETINYNSQFRPKYLTEYKFDNYYNN